jgi:hypothetical protein
VDAHWVVYLALSPALLGLSLRLFISVFLSVSSLSVSRLLAGLGVVPRLVGVRLGLLGLEVAIS